MSVQYVLLGRIQLGKASAIFVRQKSQHRTITGQIYTLLGSGFYYYWSRYEKWHVFIPHLV